MSDNETVNEGKFLAAPEGIVLAYAGMVVMAVSSLVIGANRSNKKTRKPGDQVLNLNMKDALIIPIIFGIGLVGIYLLFGEVSTMFKVLYTLFVVTVLCCKRIAAFFTREPQEPLFGQFSLPAFRLRLSHGNSTDMKYLINRGIGPKTSLLMWVIFVFVIDGVLDHDKEDTTEGMTILLTVFLTIKGVVTLSSIIKPFTRCFPAINRNTRTMYGIRITRNDKPDTSEDVIDWKFGYSDLLNLGICSIFGYWYFSTKHWIANNVLGMSLAIDSIEMLQLDSVGTGCILLGLLLLYDAFFVFGTDIMMTVATKLEAPIKLTFPVDFLQNGFAAKQLTMLGLGDVVLPGIFIALMLHFDKSLKRNSKLYFYTSLLAYTFGLVVTIIILQAFKHGQPALLYLVPLSVLTPLGIALAEGDLLVMFRCQKGQCTEKDEQKNNGSEKVDGKEEKRTDNRKKASNGERKDDNQEEEDEAADREKEEEKKGQ